MKYWLAGPLWNGYLVVQCKQKQARGATPKDEADWAIKELNREMERYKTAKRKRRRPDYFLFITNAHLSAQQATGGKDRFVERLNYWKGELGIKEADVWDRDKLNNLVDITPKVAERFGLLHSGNLIHHVAQAFLSHQQGVETTLSVFLQEELRIDQFVLLAQAGHASDSRPPLARVFVDLQAVPESSPEQVVYVVQEVQQKADRPLHPTLLREERQLSGESWRAHMDEEEYEEAESDLGEEDEEEQARIAEIFDSIPEEKYGPSRFVIVGGPGQGKSTLGQFLAQRYHPALLRADTTRTLEFETNRTLQVIEQAAAESGTCLPICPRWPFRIILQEFAGALAQGEVGSVLEYIAAQVHKRSKRSFTAQDAELMLTNSALFVVFDGLDEVPAGNNRTEVLDAVAATRAHPVASAD